MGRFFFVLHKVANKTTVIGKDLPQLIKEKVAIADLLNAAKIRH
jgi:hypothetical protein